MPKPAACAQCDRTLNHIRRGLCSACRKKAPAEAGPSGDAPGGPTSARPGTEEKVRVLAERARLGLSLWHPGDATLGSPQAGGPPDEGEEEED